MVECLPDGGHAGRRPSRQDVDEADQAHMKSCKAFDRRSRRSPHGKRVVDGSNPRQTPSGGTPVETRVTRPLAGRHLHPLRRDPVAAVWGHPVLPPRSSPAAFVSAIDSLVEPTSPPYTQHAEGGQAEERSDDTPTYRDGVPPTPLRSCCRQAVRSRVKPGMTNRALSSRRTPGSPNRTRRTTPARRVWSRHPGGRRDLPTAPDGRARTSMSRLS